MRYQWGAVLYIFRNSSIFASKGNMVWQSNWRYEIAQQSFWPLSWMAKMMVCRWYTRTKRFGQLREWWPHCLTAPQNIGVHLRNIFQSQELDKEATTEKISVVQTEGEKGRMVYMLGDQYKQQSDLITKALNIGFEVLKENGELQFEKDIWKGG